jgi:hypothetical protein
VRYVIRKYWFTCEWQDFFDLLEFAVQLLHVRRPDSNVWFPLGNELLEQEGCAYRFIAAELAPITNPLEMAEVQNAAECSIAPVANHIREALGLLPPSPESSPRNSVKESISAVAQP